MYLHAQIELSGAGTAKFIETAPRFRAIFEAEGVILEKAMMFQTGRLNTLVHLWRVDSAERFFAAVAVLKAHPDRDELFQVLADSVVNETLTFAEDTPYAPIAGER